MSASFILNSENLFTLKNRFIQNEFFKEVKEKIRVLIDIAKRKLKKGEKINYTGFKRFF